MYVRAYSTLLVSTLTQLAQKSAFTMQAENGAEQRNWALFPSKNVIRMFIHVQFTQTVCRNAFYLCDTQKGTKAKSNQPYFDANGVSDHYQVPCVMNDPHTNSHQTWKG